MTLEEKILKISENPIADVANIGLLPTGNAATIEEFFNKFVKPRLPEEKTVKQWHKILMEYTDEENWPELSCCVRYGNNGGKKKSKWGETDYFKLRRGWLTKNKDDKFEYFFADNSFPAFVYKMALDGFCPANADELKNVFKEHKFPYSFGFFVDKTKNEYKGVVIAEGRNPGFLGNYKLSHIFDAGKYFDIYGIEKGDAELSDEYYPIGHSNDFLRNPDRIRVMEIDDFSKKVIIAKFLRFAHPFNYFLTPTKKHHICGEYVYKKDIGEDPRMISFLKTYLEATYPAEYSEFKKRIMWFEGTDIVVATGKERIDITYGMSINSKGVKKAKKSSKNPKTDIFAAFEEYAKNKGVKNPAYYSKLIEKVMRELNILTLDDLERCIDCAIDYCTKKMDDAKVAGDNTTQKDYSNRRSTLRKYKEYLEAISCTENEEEKFLNMIENFMRTESEISENSIKIYRNQIKKLLESGYNMTYVCEEIERIVQDFSKGGQLYDPKDHGNTKSALSKAKKMINGPYIHYEKGWFSFVPKDEYITGYCIAGNKITIFKNIGFVNAGSEVKEISSEDMEELVSVLDEAINNNLLQSSENIMSTEHGDINKYEYSYCGALGMNCSCLFKDILQAIPLKNRYDDLIQKITN